MSDSPICNLVRSWLTMRLILLAMKTCVMGDCYDNLKEALDWEKAYD